MTAAGDAQPLVASAGQATALDTAQQLPLWRRAGRVVFDASRILVVWWWATIPAAVVWRLSGSLLLAGMTALTIAIGGWWGPEFDRTISLAGVELRVRGGFSHSLHRTTEWWDRLVWPHTAKVAALVGPVGGYHRSPKLIRYERDMTRFRPAWQRRTIKPLPTQHRQSWGVIADQLMRYLDQADVQIEVDERNRLTMWFCADPLPAMARLPLDRVGAVEDYVPIGVGVGGRTFGWRPDITPHVTITGITRGGKGVATRNIEAHAVACGWVIDRANPKGKGESDWLKPYASMAETMPGMWAQAAAILDEFDRRRAIVDELGIDNWTHARDAFGPRRLYIIDEGNNFIGAQNKGEDKELLVLSSWIVSRIAAMAAFIGIHLVYVTQSPNVESYGLSGGPTRLNIGGRMIVGQSSSTWIRELFQGEITPAVEFALAKGIKGRTIFEGLGDDNHPGVSKGQVFYADQSDVATLIPNEPPAPVVDYDTVGPDRFDDVQRQNLAADVERRALADSMRKQAQHDLKQQQQAGQEAA